MPTFVDSQSRWMRSFLLRLLAVGMLLGLSACPVPKEMLVDKGLEPQNEDEKVRFRTTYYFRVFDYCADSGNATVKPPFAIDSLYRFRMTGKAKALINKIHFESGTLKAYEIDPFGARIAYDDENDQFYFKSQAEVKEEAERQEKLDELDRLVNTYQKIARDVHSVTRCAKDKEVCLPGTITVCKNKEDEACDEQGTQPTGDPPKCAGDKPLICPSDKEKTCSKENMVCPEEPFERRAQNLVGGGLA